MGENQARQRRPGSASSPPEWDQPERRPRPLPASREMDSVSVYARIERSFARQSFMQHLGATLVEAEPGLVKISLPSRPELCQQDDFVHAGALAAVMDSACGYAALTAAGDGADVLTIEFKINLLQPAVGESFLAIGRVVRRGRSITVAVAEAYAGSEVSEQALALMQATIRVYQPGR